METKIFKSINLIRRGSGANLNLFRYAAMVVVLLTLGIGNAWAGGSSYYTGFKATGGATGRGYVYASTSNPATPVYETEVTAESQSDNLGENGTKKYYAWAKAVRGSEFNGWSVSGDNGNVTPTSGTDSPITVTVTSAKDKTNTGTATASWTTYTKVNVTYNPSEDGIYSVTYQYDSYNATTKEITTGDAENLSRTISSENGAQMIGSYKNDVITLKSTSGTFQGWYSDAGFTSQLSTDNPYTYTAPTSGSAAVYPKYEHVDKYYGRLTASIAEVPYSMPGGGTIFVSKEEAGTGTYSDATQTVDNTGMGTTSLKYYLHAKPNDKRYVFRGWYSNPECTGTALSTNADYAYTFTSSSTNSASPTTGNIYAAFDFNLYYMQVEVEPGTASQGLGMVIASDQSLGTPEYTQYASYSEQFLYAYRLAPTANAYLYAKAKYGYKFSGWYDNAACTGTALSTANPYTYAATGTSTDPMNPTIVPVYAKFVEDASTINITYNLPDQTKGEYTASVLDIEEVDDEYVWTFTEVFTSAGKTANTTQAQHKSDVLRLEAACKAGYGVTSWTIAGTAKTTPSHLYETSVTAAATYGVTFGDAKPFLVSTNSTQYATLAEALAAVGNSGRITVVQDAYVPAGTYTIPSGVTLVVPFDANGSNYTSLSSTYTVHASWSKPSCFSKLTLASGCTINVNNNAVINVAAKEFEPDGGNKGVGAVATAYGQIDMEAGSAINVHSGGKLYCWGYITGDGMVTIENGAAVTEMLQTVSRGGTAFSSFAEYDEGDHCFPLNQYYIQNIEAYLRVNYGATETVWTSLYIRGDKITSGTFIGSNGSGFFELSSGSYLIRKYDPTTDRINYDIYGSAKLSHLSIKIYIDIDTKNYTMPITNNMTVNCHAIGDTPATVTVSYRMALLPSAVLSIGKNVTVDVSKKLYVYDKDEWVGKSFSYLGTDVTPICYSPTKTKTRASADLVDAKVIVNGTLKCSGEVYTTSSGAQICSSNNEGTGVVHFAAAAGTDANTYQAVQSGSSISTPAIPMTSAKLQNGDGSYVTTVGTTAGSKFYYSKSNEKWMKDPKTISWNANGGETADATTVYSDGSFLGELPAAYKEGHTFAGWWTAASGGTQITQTTKVTANETYYAHWTPIVYNISYMDQGKQAFSGTHIDSPNAHPTKHTYGTATTLNGVNNKTGYTFGGWHTISNCKAESKVTSLGATAVSKDITLYAKWTPQTYTITYKDKDDADFSGTSWESNQPTEHTYGTATTLVNPYKANYTFDGWYTTSACTGSAVTSLGATAYTANIILYANWNETTHTVTVSAGANGSVSSASVSGVGAATASGDITATPNIGYNFSGWTLPDGVTAASSYTTSSNPIHINATADDKTITANWSAVTYNLTYEGLNGATNSNPSIYTIETATISLADPGAREGYTFTGWTCGGNSITQITLGSTGDKTITANWTINKYKVTFDSNGGSAVSTIEQNYNTAVTAPADPTREGYTFAGWDPAVPSPMPASNTNCVAQWTANTNTAYTVKHYQQNLDGTYPSTPTETSNLTGTTGEEVTPDRKSYEGFDAPAGETVTILADGSRVVIYQYTRNSYTLSWVTDGDALTGSYTHGETKFGAAITAPNTPTKTGYTFNGWTPAKAETMPAAATTYTATWTANTNTAYTVEHYWQNINDDNYTKHETVNMTGTTDATTAAVAMSYDGFDSALPFSQGTIAPNGSTVVKIYYNRETYTIIWDANLSIGQVAHKEETLRYGAMPSYGADPTYGPTESQVFAFSGWTPTPYEVDKDQTYNGSFNVSPRPYKITFVNDNGVELWHSDFGYGSTPSYGGSTPVSSHTGDGYTYTHAGWKPALAPVNGPATYTAKYDRSAEAIVVKTPETVVNNTIAPTTTVEDHGTLTIGDTENDVTLQTNVTVVENGGELVVSNGSSIVKEDPSEESIIIVESGGQLNVEVGGSVEADVFIIEATTKEQGTNPEALEEVQVSGELSETGSKNVTSIYYDLTRKGGTEKFLARVWYAVAVPWAVEVPNYANGGVFIKRGENFVPQRLGATFDLISYDGNCRAQNGAGANCWVYLEDEIIDAENKRVMVPGKLYMIYLTEETYTIRFKKKAGEAIHTNSLTVSAHTETSNENDANWNGIANPATYNAYMNVSANGLVQKFVPGTQPRDGGSYLPLDLTDKQAVGQPFFVQVDPTAGTSVVVTRNNPPTLAPRRAKAEGDKEVRYAIGIAANGKLADRLYIQTAEEKEDKYVIGQDMSKMGISNYVAQMWVARYDVKLCLNTMALTRDKAVYPLGIYAPQAGEYMIFAPADMASGDIIYLTYDGRVIWNLTMAPYYATLEKGTTTSYGLRLIRSNAPAVTTGVDEVQGENAQCTKVILDDHVYILRGEELYTITGQKAK